MCRAATSMRIKRSQECAERIEIGCALQLVYVCTSTRVTVAAVHFKCLYVYVAESL